MLNNMKIKKPERLVLVVFSIIVLLLSAPILQKGLIPGHDWAYQLNRIQNIGNGLKLGIFPNKIHMFSLNSYGYGSGLFYPDFFLYIPAFLMLFGLSLNVSYKIFLILIILSLVCSAYFSAKYIFKSRLAGTVATILFSTSQTIVTNMYIRTALGETLATIFVPLVVAAVYNIIYEKFSKPHLLIIAFTGLVYTHTITLFLAGMISAFLLLLNIHKVFLFKKDSKSYNLQILLKMLLCVLSTLALSISYWLPMLEQLMNYKFNVNTSRAIGQMADFTVNTNILVLAKNLPGTMGIIIFISVLIAGMLLALNDANEKLKICKVFMLLGFATSISTLSFFYKVWQVLNETIISFTQFPWRLHIFAITFLAFGAAGTLTFLIKKSKQKKLLILLLPICSMLYCASCIKPITKYVVKTASDITLYKIYGGFEWLPAKTEISQLTTPHMVYDENRNTIELNKKDGNKLSFYSNSSQYFDVPLLYYKGYSAYIISKAGQKNSLIVDKSSNNNLVRVHNKEKHQGEIHVFYKGTPLQLFSYAANIASFTTLILYIILFNLKKNKNAKLIASKGPLNNVALN